MRVDQRGSSRMPCWGNHQLFILTRIYLTHPSFAPRRSTSLATMTSALSSSLSSSLPL